MNRPDALLWWLGWLANRLPVAHACRLPRPVIEAGYRQLYREWQEH